ncbi:hypothetical protein EG68_02692 [Paragonimus skrjabini miyazakii]|uniref:Uncharacterized protein n=1 Tax=Paragonimus skrjabini miyazakii TaxID=59628 RepID=A0A8S9Z3H2_9TREM|nr:hypothetical protein EG68_02692 [Paragonimus skrjabini miyazakii]
MKLPIFYFYCFKASVGLELVQCLLLIPTAALHGFHAHLPQFCHFRCTFGKECANSSTVISYNYRCEPRRTCTKTPQPVPTVLHSYYDPSSFASSAGPV